MSEKEASTPSTKYSLFDSSGVTKLPDVYILDLILLAVEAEEPGEVLALYFNIDETEVFEFLSIGDPEGYAIAHHWIQALHMQPEDAQRTTAVLHEAMACLAQCRELSSTYVEMSNVFAESFIAAERDGDPECIGAKNEREMKYLINHYKMATDAAIEFLARAEG